MASIRVQRQMTSSSSGPILLLDRKTGALPASVLHALASDPENAESQAFLAATERAFGASAAPFPAPPAADARDVVLAHPTSFI